MKVVVIIPARYASTRLPGKPLVDLAGRPMIRHVYDRAREAAGVAEVAVATDDDRVAEAVRAFGGRVVRTSPDCPSGTDRVAEAARALLADGLEFDAVVNLQGDEPLLEPAAVAQVAALLAPEPTTGPTAEAPTPPHANPDAEAPTVPHAGHTAATARAPFATLARDLLLGELDDPNVVKVVTDARGYALYFSRAPIGRDRELPDRSAARAHVGLYAYTRSFLEQFTRLPPTPLERAERLEQLRALEHGLPLAVGHTTWRSRGVDTPEDLARVRAEIERT